jgi:V/A-type H+-transporting ATPase subunit K
MTAITLFGNFSTNCIPGILASADTAQNYMTDTINSLTFFGQIGVVIMLGLAAFGSSVGIGAAGQAAAGAWGKEGKAGKTLSFTYIILLGMPISQTLYAMIVMNKIGEVLKRPEIAAASAGLLLGIGIATGLGEMLSAWMQGLIGAAGIRSLSESEGKGFAFLLIAMGIVETVGIFTMVFLLGMIPALPDAAAAM